MASNSDVAPSSATNAVLVASEPIPEGTHQVRGVDFDRFKGRDITAAELVENMIHTGFQGSGVAEAARIIKDMVCKQFPIIYHTQLTLYSAHTSIPRPAKRPPSSWVTPRT